jgi:hypothetical protein
MHYMRDTHEQLKAPHALHDMLRGTTLSFTATHPAGQITPSTGACWTALRVAFMHQGVHAIVLACLVGVLVDLKPMLLLSRQ